MLRLWKSCGTVGTLYNEPRACQGSPSTRVLHEIFATKPVVKLWPGSESACHGGGWMTRRMRRGCLGGAAPRPLHPFRRFVSRIRGDATPESRRSGTCTYPRAFSRTLSTSAPSTETWARTRPCAASTSASEMPIPRAPQLLEARIRRQIAARTRNIPTQACRLRPRGSAPPSLRGPAMNLRGRLRQTTSHTRGEGVIMPTRGMPATSCAQSKPRRPPTRPPPIRRCR